MSPPYQQYYVSDGAYTKLIELGVQQQYILPHLDRPRGLTAFLEALSLCTFEDTRPDHVRERHDTEIRYLLAPHWASVEPRKVRVINFTYETSIRYVLVALKVGIIKDEPWLKGGPRRTRATPIVGFVLEGLGLGWITAQAPLPIKPADIAKNKRSKTIHSRRKADEFVSM